MIGGNRLHTSPPHIFLRCRFIPVPANLTTEPFLRLWEQKVLDLLLDEGRIDCSVVSQIRSWPHSGFHVDRSIHLAAGDRAGTERLAQYMARSPGRASLPASRRLVRITPEGKVIYRAEKEHCRSFPKPASEDLFGGISRNFQVFDPLDFIADLTQHIPDKGEHLIRYYGEYSNKARRGRAPSSPLPPGEGSVASGNAGEGAPEVEPLQRARRRWAILIQKVYEVDPLTCPKCGGAMKIISFIESRQADVLEKILRHCGLWENPPPPRAPPARPPPADSDERRTIEVDPDFLDHCRREAAEDQPTFDW